MKTILLLLFVSIINFNFAQFTGVSYLTNKKQYNGVSDTTMYNYHMGRWERKMGVVKMLVGVSVLINVYTLTSYNMYNQQTMRNINYYSVGVYYLTACFYFSANREKQKAHKFI